jgi:DNA-binding NarL/FixJ family response regulator
MPTWRMHHLATRFDVPGHSTHREWATIFPMSIAPDASGASRCDEPRQQDAPVQLSERESMAVRLIALGYSNKQIAARLGVSIKTVETYKARAHDKLGVRGRVGLVQFAIRSGWMTVESAAEITGMTQ